MLAGALELFLVSLGLTYYVATIGAGVRVLRRTRRARRVSAAGRTHRSRPAGRGAGRAGGQLSADTGGPAAEDDGTATLSWVASLSGKASLSGEPSEGSLAGEASSSGEAGESGWSGRSGHSAGRRRRPAAAAGIPGRTSPGGGRWGRLRSRLETAEEPPPRAGVLVPPEDCVVYFIVPCMNEELVVGDTVRSLLADSRALVVVVDDASDDRTGELAASVDASRVIVVRRELPEARLGKGPAINTGFTEVLRDAGVRGIAASRITVCVMDADGRLSDGAVDAVLPLLEDQRVGGVQLPVRIRNRNSMLTVMQDLEFWGVCAIAQLGRMASGTVSLGGNGQFTRLAALLEMGPTPWQAQLTEDLDLSLALAAKGWRLTSSPDAHVSQQGVTSLRALVNQRTRWYQGHMQAVRWLRELWSSRQLSHLAMLELTIYLLVPWVLVLPWSIIFNYNLLIMVLWIFGRVTTPGLGEDLTQKIATVAFWYLVSCLPIYMAGFLYAWQERKVGYVRAFFIGHLLLIGNYVTYAACWRAVYRLITGSHGWEKTRRTDEHRIDERRIDERRIDERHAVEPRVAALAPAPALPLAAAVALAAAVPSAAITAAPAVSPLGVLSSHAVPSHALVPGPRLAAGEPDDDVITVPNLQAIREPASGPAREPVLAAVGSHGEAAAVPGPGRHAPSSPAPRDRPARGSHRAGRSRSAHRSGRPAR